MSALISVIVPVYNTEAYLDKCVQSILAQTYQNLEIILIDDGSTDGSSKKCDEYAQSDGRIIVIHKKNGGLSSARNAGLDACRGDYISFIDSDDWIEPNMYSTLVELLEEHDVSLAIAGRYDVYEGVETKTVEKRLHRDGLAEASEIFPQMMISRLSDFSVCDKLHRKDLWENTRFPKGEIYEDLAVMYKILLSAGKVVLCDKPFYSYRHRNESIVTGNFRESLTDYPKHTEQLLADVSARYPEYINYAVWSHIKAIQVVLIKLLRSDRKTYVAYRRLYEAYIRDIKKYRPVWSRDPLFSSVDRLICKILLHKGAARCVFLLKKPSR